jgi:hypothetical protein
MNWFGMLLIVLGIVIFSIAFHGTQENVSKAFKQ